MSQWVGIIGGAAGLITSILALATFFQNRRIVRITQDKLAAETDKVEAETEGAGINALRGIIAELRADLAAKTERIEKLETRASRSDLKERSLMQHADAMSEFVVEHWRIEHPGEKPAPPIFTYIELDQTS